MKRPLRDLKRGDVFRTADGRLWWLYAHGQPPYGRSWASGVGREEDTFPLPSDESVELLDLPALLSGVADLERENDFLRGQLSDLWEDRTGAAVAAEAERGAVRELIRTWWKVGGKTPSVINLLALLDRRGPCRPPVPPHRLEGALREVADVLERYLGPGNWGAVAVGELRALLARVREALGEGS